MENQKKLSWEKIVSRTEAKKKNSCKILYSRS